MRYLLLLLITSQAFSASLKEGASVLKSFVDCRKKSQQEYLSCADKYLSKEMSQLQRNKTAAWPLMGFKVSPAEACDQEADRFFQLKETYELQLCFDVFHENISRRGTVYFKLEGKDLKILHFQY